MRQNYFTPEGTVIVPVHLLLRETGRIACVPWIERFHEEIGREETWARTDDVRAVTCPVCKTMGSYKAMKEELDAVLAARVPAL